LLPEKFEKIGKLYAKSYFDYRGCYQRENKFSDVIGKLELRGAGFEKVLQAAINSEIKILVCTVKKRFFNDIVEKYGFQNCPCIDLDILDRDPAAEKITRYIDDSFFSD
jgi:nucleoside-triphosphatase THEP1